MNRLVLEPSPTLSDERLAKLSADGIDSAFAILVLRHRRALVRHCAEVVGYAEAEEAVQEALLRAYLALVRGESVTHVGAWLRTIAHNAAVNMLRARSARPAVGHQEAGPERVEGDTFARRESLREVVHALEELPERQRQALVMRELEGRSYAEIEARLDATNGAVRQLLNRARAAVRERFGAAAALIPAARWIVGEGGAAPTAARLGALSGGCAVTLKLCAAAVLPAVIAVGTGSPGPARSTPHAANVSSLTPDRGAVRARSGWRSTRATVASQPRLASTSRPQRSAHNLVGARAGERTPAPQPGGRTSSHSSISGTPTPVKEGGVSAAAPDGRASGRSSATTPGSSALATHTTLRMGTNILTGSMTPSASPGSPPGGGSGSPPGTSGPSPTGSSRGSSIDGSRASSAGGSTGSPRGGSKGSPMPRANETTPPNGSGGMSGVPQRGRERG